MLPRLKRRHFLASAFAAFAQSAVSQSLSKPSAPTAIPGAWPGRVVAVQSPRCVISGAYQAETVRDMMRKGMTQLTGAPGWVDAWRSLFEKGDVVSVNVC